MLDFLPKSSIIIVRLAGLCKGSTTDSDSVCEGSNPSPAAIPKSLETQGLSEIRLFHGKIGIALCYADFLLLGLFRSCPKIKRTDEVVDDKERGAEL